MNISTVIIAKNEEFNIRRCIKSVVDISDEVIVLVDNTTNDNTFNIAKEFAKVKAELINWEGFSPAKRKGISVAKNEWILWIDADEELSEQLINELKGFLNSEPNKDIYAFPRKAYFLGKWINHSGWYPGYVNRLFNKNKCSLSNDEVHETLMFKGEPGKFKNDILHYTDLSIEHYFDKFNNYTSLAAIDLEPKKKNFKLSDVLIRPLWLFAKMYIIKQGFLDGFQGFVLAVFSSLYVFTKYCKLWELKNKDKIFEKLKQQ